MNESTSYVRSVNDYSISAHEKFNEVRKNKEVEFSGMIYVNFYTDGTYGIILEDMQERFPHLTVIADMTYDDGEEPSDYTVYRQTVLRSVEKSTIVECLEKNRQIICTVFTETKEDRDEIALWFKNLRKSYSTKPEVKNTVFMIAQNQNGFYLNPMPINEDHKYSEQLIAANYNEDFENVIHPAIIKAIDSDKKGLILLHGLPGTGKSSYIKQMIYRGSTRKFIYVPSHLTGMFANPSFIEFAKSELKGNVVVLEDAESILLERGSAESNRDAVSNLLNMTDGITADSLNILFIITFNAQEEYIDKALMRKGRMLLKYNFKELSPDKASALIYDLHGIDQKVNAMTLADVYGYDDESQIVIDSDRKTKVSFGFQHK